MHISLRLEEGASDAISGQSLLDSLTDVKFLSCGRVIDYSYWLIGQACLLDLNRPRFISEELFD